MIMIDRLKNELLKISEPKEAYHFIQNKNEFMSIIFVIDTPGINGFISIDHPSMKCLNTEDDIKIKSINQDRQFFSDGSTFESYFEKENKIDKV